MAEKNLPAPEEGEDAVPRRNSLKLLLIVLLVLLPIGGAGAAYVMMSRHPDKSKSTSKPKPRPTMGVTLPLESFIVNLNEPGGNRYLKVTVDLELGEASEPELKPLMPRLRDPLLVYLSELKVGDALRPGTKQIVRKKVLELATAAFGTGTVRAVYFKEFVMQ